MTTSDKASSSKKATSSSSQDGNALMVTMMDQTVRDAPKETYMPVTLRCPNSGQEKEYLLLTVGKDQHHLLEVQCLEDSGPKTFSSWFVGNRVVSNGKLFLMTRVDPLFWVLPASIGTLSTQWQPMDQLLPVCTTVQKVLDPRQLQHLCESYEMDEDEIFYKFSRAKTLAWLAKKQQSVEKVLLQQFLAAREREEKVDASEGGACANDFCLTSEVRPVEAESTSNGSKQMTAQAKRESLQIVCNYLSSEWQTAFLEHMKSDITVLQEPQKEKTVKRAKVEVTATQPPISEHYAAMVTPKEKPPPPKKTLAQKKLDKVNKKGMKSMTSFFTVKKKS